MTWTGKACDSSASDCVVLPAIRADVPSQKRLAVRVEDHPLAYAQFSGRIPAGQYGAGDVAIWDHGTYENLLADKPVPQPVTDGIAAGRLEFVLHGKKLQGRFTLIRMKAKRRGRDSDLQNLYVRPVALKSGARLSFLYRHKTRDVVKNHTVEEGLRYRVKIKGEYEKGPPYALSVERITKIKDYAK